ncbi:hypothetical protein BDN70DRAFT_940102 [Pholiota conissans]|uniref:Uncharacterized protein n=1 Tax=Pholiota conissans TaxID=109636 RepID=A0A9P5YIS7_9AGAR|nr:hypothetical protein BDN70DRAFT_940102 [Pholiota conissans]
MAVPMTAKSCSGVGAIHNAGIANADRREDGASEAPYPSLSPSRRQRPHLPRMPRHRRPCHRLANTPSTMLSPSRCPLARTSEWERLNEYSRVWKGERGLLEEEGSELG